MRPLGYFYLVIALLCPAVACAGQIYGSITSAGKAVGRTPLEVNCGGNSTPGATTPDGSYRINVVQTGRCTLTLPTYRDRPSAIIFSNPNPSSYNFELAEQDGHFELRRR